MGDTIRKVGTGLQGSILGKVYKEREGYGGGAAGRGSIWLGLVGDVVLYRTEEMDGGEFRGLDRSDFSDVGVYQQLTTPGGCRLIDSLGSLYFTNGRALLVVQHDTSDESMPKLWVLDPLNNFEVEHETTLRPPPHLGPTVCEIGERPYPGCGEGGLPPLELKVAGQEPVEMTARSVSTSATATTLCTKEGTLFYIGNGTSIFGIPEKNGSSPLPIPLAPLLGVKVRMCLMSSSAEHALFITEDSTLYSSGKGLEGELGYMVKPGRVSPPTKVELAFRVRTGAVGKGRSAVVSEDGEAYFFGKLLETPALVRQRNRERKKKKMEEGKPEKGDEKKKEKDPLDGMPMGFGAFGGGRGIFNPFGKGGKGGKGGGARGGKGGKGEKDEAKEKDEKKSDSSVPLPLQGIANQRIISISLGQQPRLFSAPTLTSR